MVPVDKIVHVLVTGADVIHSFAVPAFGIKIDAVPGRMNETWFKATRWHLLRPVLGALRHRPRLHADRGQGGERPDFDAWVADAKKKFATQPGDSSPRPAAAGAVSAERVARRRHAHKVERH